MDKEMDIHTLLRPAMKAKASDLQVHAGQVPWVRVNGKLHKLNVPEKLTAEQVSGMIRSIMPNKYQAEFGMGKDVDFMIQLDEEDTRFRINAFHTTRGPAMTLRVLSPKMPRLSDLGLPPAVNKLINAEKGLFLVTGATGSGKSTSLAAMVNHLNQTTNQHIITIEDPVEYSHESDRSLITQRELNSSVESFPAALKSALREDPDIIYIGEIRDRETALEALHAAQTGHLVFATLHTGAAPKAADRIIGMFDKQDQEFVRNMLADNLIGVLTQQLLERADGQGRVAAGELMVVNSAVQNQIRKADTRGIFSTMQTGMRDGMVTMQKAIDRLRDDGVISDAAHREAEMTYRREAGMSESRGV